MPSVAPRSSKFTTTACHIQGGQLANGLHFDGRSKYAILPHRLWSRLAEPEVLQQAVTVPLAVTFPLQPASGADSQAPSNDPITWIYAASTTKQHDDDEQKEAPILLSHFPLGQPTSYTVTVSAHTPVALSRVILTTPSRQVLDAARPSFASAASQLAVSMAGSLIGQGDIVSLPSGLVRIIQSEPVLQGRVEASTDLLVVYDEDFEDGSAEEAMTMEQALDISRTECGDEDGLDSAFSIDERFLAHSVIGDFDDDDLDTGHLGMNNDATPRHGFAVSSQIPQELSAAKSRGLPAYPLKNRAALTLAISEWNDRQEAPVEVDQESAVLLPEGLLASLGGFDGDWAMAELLHHSKPRLIRLFTQSAPKSLDRHQQRALLPPSLFQNLQKPETFEPWPRRFPNLLVLPLRRPSRSVGPLACPLPIPFADALTIARVPSALSTNRAYQPLFLDGLRQYFEGKKRIVREGDVIAVGVETGRVRWIAHQKTDDKAPEDNDSQRQVNYGSSEGIVDYGFPSAATAGPPTGVVHFLVTSLTQELSAPSTGTTEDYELTYLARQGLLGSVVDPTLTNIVQTGISGSKIADAEAWLGVMSDTPSLPCSDTATPLSSPSSAFGCICQLVQTTLLPRASSYGIHLSVLLKGARGSGKTTAVRWAAKKTGVHLIEINCYEILGDTDTHTEGVLRARFESAALCGPAILLLRNIDALARKSQAMETGQEPATSNLLRDCVSTLRAKVVASKPYQPVAVFATTSDPDKCPNGILASFKHEVVVDAPNEAERLEILQGSVKGATLSPDVSLKEIATQTAALVAVDLTDLVSRAKLASVERVRNSLANISTSGDHDLAVAGISLTAADFGVALSKARANYSESIGTPKIPNVTWDDVGGLALVKHDILDTIQLPLEHPELFADGLKKRSGVLLYGPPGTGKTLLAKAVATSCSLNFFSVKGPELLNMYIGESEANVRRVFQRARNAKPCVIFFDELDSVAPKRGNQGDSGGVMDRIVSQLLAELDGMAAGSKQGTDVFVIGATNRPDLLDPALLRPGRFDRMLYLSVSETHEAQLNILQALTRKFKLDPDVGDLSCIAEQCPFNLTGADFYALCSDAMLKAMIRQARQVDTRIAALNAEHESNSTARTVSKRLHPINPEYYLSELASPEEVQVSVKREDFELALDELVPSVSEAEMEHYRGLQAQFSKPQNDSQGHQGADSKELAGADSFVAGGTNMHDLARIMQQAALDCSPTNGSATHSSVSKGKGRVIDSLADEHENRAIWRLSSSSDNKGKGKARDVAVGIYAQPVEAPSPAAAVSPEPRLLSASAVQANDHGNVKGGLPNNGNADTVEAEPSRELRAQETAAKNIQNGDVSDDDGDACPKPKGPKKRKGNGKGKGKARE